VKNHVEYEIPIKRYYLFVFIFGVGAIVKALEIITIGTNLKCVFQLIR